MENAVDPQNKSFRDKGIWYLTPKGLCVLQDFCVRTEVSMSNLRKHFSHMEAIHLVRLERNLDDDQLILNRATASVVFKVMMTDLPLDGELSNSDNARSSPVPTRSNPPSSASSTVSSTTSSSTHSRGAPFVMSSSLSHDSRVQMLGNYLLTLSVSSRISQSKTVKTMRTVFSSQMCCDWLMEFTTLASREEAESIAQCFIKYNWLEFQDIKYNGQPLKPSKMTMFVVTEKGKQIVSEPVKSATTMNLDSSKIRGDGEATLQEILSQDPETILLEDQVHSRPPSTTTATDSNDSKESNSARLKIILENAKLRSPFKDFLRANFCEENLDFWIDYNTLRRKCRSQSPALFSQYQKGLLEDAYDIWTTYLASGAPSELNVEHALCLEMARVVNSVVTVMPAYNGQGKPTIFITTSSPSQSLRLILKLFDKVNDHICRLMATDSVPKFIKTEKYRKIIESMEKNERKKQRELEELSDSLRNMGTLATESQEGE